MSWFSTRPPTRSRASTTTTEAPARDQLRAPPPGRPGRPRPPRRRRRVSADRPPRRTLHRPTVSLWFAMPSPLAQPSARRSAAQHADAGDRKRRVRLGGRRHLAALDRRHLDRRGDHPCPRGAGQRAAAPADRADRPRLDERPAGARPTRRDGHARQSRRPTATRCGRREPAPAPPDTAAPGARLPAAHGSRAPAAADRARRGGRHGRDRLRRSAVVTLTAGDLVSGRVDRQGRRPHDALRRHGRARSSSTEQQDTDTSSRRRRTRPAPATDQAPSTADHRPAHRSSTDRHDPTTQTAATRGRSDAPVPQPRCPDAAVAAARARRPRGTRGGRVCHRATSSHA